ncbi:hypothetical protein LJC49_03055, partial [Ruminococcaceae bacterium OttesenSCG-928-I18]|nr:hypothetical protein [Ruminococcaceae bacterium OttesenSCG-928-I18]
MPKKATKEQETLFRSARKEAAAFNERLSSMDGVAEETGIDRTRVQRIETGVLIPYPEEVVLMIDVYHKPELRPHYCATLCPLGKGNVFEPACTELDRTTNALLSELRNADKIANYIMDIADSGCIDEEKLQMMREKAVPAIDELVKDLLAYRITVEKALKQG